jgi:hypothetical protein
MRIVTLTIPLLLTAYPSTPETLRSKVPESALNMLRLNVSDVFLTIVTLLIVQRACQSCMAMPCHREYLDFMGVREIMAQFLQNLLYGKNRNMLRFRNMLRIFQRDRGTTRCQEEDGL